MMYGHFEVRASVNEDVCNTESLQNIRTSSVRHLNVLNLDSVALTHNFKDITSGYSLKRRFTFLC